MSRSHIVLDDDDDFVQPASHHSTQQNSKAAFRNFLYGFIESTVEAKRADWSDLYEDFDEKHGDRWYMWWGKREWYAWVDHILQRCRVNDPGLHGCVIYSTASDTSYRYQNGYGKWMYRATNYDNMLGKWDTDKVPLPTTKTSEQVHRLLAYLCTDNKDLRYAVGHFKKPQRDADDMKDSSPLILVHLCNNGENGCVNPNHIVLDTAVQNMSRNGCKCGARYLCPHTPKCIFVDKLTGALIPSRNVDSEAAADLTLKQLNGLTYSDWVTNHFDLRPPVVQQWTLPDRVPMKKRYRGSQSGYMKKYRKRKREDVDDESDSSSSM